VAQLQSQLQERIAFLAPSLQLAAVEVEAEIALEEMAARVVAVVTTTLLVEQERLVRAEMAGLEQETQPTTLQAAVVGVLQQSDRMRHHQRLVEQVEQVNRHRFLVHQQVTPAVVGVVHGMELEELVELVAGEQVAVMTRMQHLEHNT
jgi:hypothetical protein